MSNKTYDIIKWFAQIVLPAIGTLYFALAGIWGLPYAEQVVGTIVAVDTFLGVVLGYSSSQYNKTEATGDANITAKEGE
jgi:hypothetical protein